MMFVSGTSITHISISLGSCFYFKFLFHLGETIVLIRLLTGCKTSSPLEMITFLGSYVYIVFLFFNFITLEFILF